MWKRSGRPDRPDPFSLLYGSGEITLAAEVTAHELNHRSRRCLKGRTASAVFHDDAQRLRWTKLQHKEIIRLLLQHFGAMIGKTVNGNHPNPATLWRVTVKS